MYGPSQPGPEKVAVIERWPAISGGSTAFHSPQELMKIYAIQTHLLRAAVCVLARLFTCLVS